MKILTFLLLLTFSAITISCIKNNSYEHCDEFVLYLKEIHNIDVEHEDKTYFILPLDGCDNCIELNLNLLLNNKFDIQLILIGNSFDKERNRKIENLEIKYNNVLKDSKYLISPYRTGLAKPMIITIKDNKCTYHLNVSDFKIKEAETYLKNRK